MLEPRTDGDPGDERIATPYQVDAARFARREAPRGVPDGVDFLFECFRDGLWLPPHLRKRQSHATPAIRVQRRIRRDTRCLLALLVPQSDKQRLAIVSQTRTRTHKGLVIGK